MLRLVKQTNTIPAELEGIKKSRHRQDLRNKIPDIDITRTGYCAG